MQRTLGRLGPECRGRWGSTQRIGACRLFLQTQVCPQVQVLPVAKLSCQGRDCMSAKPKYFIYSYLIPDTAVYKPAALSSRSTRWQHHTRNISHLHPRTFKNLLHTKSNFCPDFVGFNQAMCQSIIWEPERWIKLTRPNKICWCSKRKTDENPKQHCLIKNSKDQQDKKNGSAFWIIKEMFIESKRCNVGLDGFFFKMMAPAALGALRHGG
jgi:hypothetical protein